MSFLNRLDAIEAKLRQMDVGADEAEQWREFQRLFCAADARGRELIDSLGQRCGSRDGRRVVTHEYATDADNKRRGELRKLMAEFANRERYVIPGARVIKVRWPNGAHLIPVAEPAPGDARFIQIFVSLRPPRGCTPPPEPAEQQATEREQQAALDAIPGRVELYRDLLERRAIPLPPLDAVDVGATALLWGSDEAAAQTRFVMRDGTTRTADEIFAGTTPTDTPNRPAEGKE